MSDPFFARTAEIRRQLTPEMMEIGRQILEKNLRAIATGNMSLSDIVESMYMEMELHRLHMRYVRVK
jgi:hypothetical protein